MQFVKSFTYHSDPHNSKLIHIFIDTERISMFNFNRCWTDFPVQSAYFEYVFVRNMIQLIISCWNVSFKKLT